MTILWLIAVPNIINLIDGFDGLAGGLGIFLASTLGIVAMHNEQLAVAWYAFTMAGALLGFLDLQFSAGEDLSRRWRRLSHRRLHRGALAHLFEQGSVAAVLLVTVVALGVPILDTAFAILRRGFARLPAFPRGCRSHSSQAGALRLFASGASCSGFYGICVVLSLLGLSIVWSQGRTLPVGIGALFLLAVLAPALLPFCAELGRRACAKSTG